MYYFCSTVLFLTKHKTQNMNANGQLELTMPIVGVVYVNYEATFQPEWDGNERCFTLEDYTLQLDNDFAYGDNKLATGNFETWAAKNDQEIINQIMNQNF